MEGDWKEKGRDARYKNHPLAASQAAVMHNPITRKLVSVSFLLRGSAEVSLCCREAGEKEKESARGPPHPIVHPALSIFRLLLILLGYPAGAFAKEREWALLKKKRDFKADAHFPSFSLSPFPLPRLLPRRLFRWSHHWAVT